MRVVNVMQIRGAMHGETLPVLNTVYTVREKVKFGSDPVGYRLVEIVNAPHDYIIPSSGEYVFGECIFDARCFRPVTDISDLQRLTKVREREDA